MFYKYALLRLALFLESNLKVPHNHFENSGGSEGLCLSFCYSVSYIQGRALPSVAELCLLVGQRFPHFACWILVYYTFFLALYFTCTLPSVYDMSCSGDSDSSFCATWLALTHGFWLPLFQFLKTVIHIDLKACWSPGGASSEASHWMSMHPSQYCKYFFVSCPRALLALVFKLSTYLKRTYEEWYTCRMKSLQCVNYTTDFNLGKDITSENGHWFTYASLKKKKPKLFPNMHQQLKHRYYKAGAYGPMSLGILIFSPSNIIGKVECF